MASNNKTNDTENVQTLASTQSDVTTSTLSDKVEKTECDDSDIMLLGNQGSSSYRKITWANIVSSLKNKFVNWLFSDLKTTDQTIPGAINELVSTTGDIDSDLQSKYSELNDTLKSDYDELKHYFMQHDIIYQ